MRTAAGMPIRKLPALTSNDEDPQEGKEKSLLLELFRNEEQIVMSHNDQLVSLFSNDAIRILSIENPSFHCSYSRERCLKGLYLLSLQEMQSIFEDGNSISLKCEFCNENYGIYETEFLIHIRNNC